MLSCLKSIPVLSLLATALLISCGQSHKSGESSSVSAERGGGSCYSDKAICEAEASSLYPQFDDPNYNKKLQAYIAKSQKCAQYFCENPGFKF